MEQPKIAMLLFPDENLTLNGERVSSCQWLKFLKNLIEKSSGALTNVIIIHVEKSLSHGDLEGNVY
jgi:hypothetical protein